MSTNLISSGTTAREKVESWIREPFVEETPEGERRPKGHRMRYAVGELLTCPFCLAQWVAGGFVLGAALAPRATRAVAALFATYGVSDALNIARSVADQRF